jgi:SAM-dependent methyltransferase
VTVKSSQATYRADLAYIHDAGFGHFAEAAAKQLLRALRAARIRRGTVVELGCGSGVLSAQMAKAGYDVVGFDISADMVELARRRVPNGTFHHASFVDAPLPACVAVAAVGEIFNYLFDRRNSPARLAQVFHRVHEALVPRGLFLFDVALVGRVPGGLQKGSRQEADWACVYQAEEPPGQHLLIRRITTFRKTRTLYRRDDEVHRLRLYESAELLARLRKTGFRVRTLPKYPGLNFPPGYVAFLCRKP